MPAPSSATEPFAAGSSSSLVDAINAASFTFHHCHLDMKFNSHLPS
jgi:hypothetical protein